MDWKTAGELATCIGSGSAGMYYLRKWRESFRRRSGDPTSDHAIRNGERSALMMAIGRLEIYAQDHERNLTEVKGQVSNIKADMRDLDNRVTTLETLRRIPPKEA